MVSVIERCMMKAVLGLGCAVCLTAAPVNAGSVEYDFSGKFLLSDTSLIDTNQSQSLEAVSTADGNLRLPSYKLAAVHFIVGDQGLTFNDFGKQNFDDPSNDYCQRLGFAVSSCASGLFNRACPYNDKIYDKCCDAAYIYSPASCSSPRTLSADVCGGKHRCYCDTAQYPFASCDAPRIKGEACSDDNGTRYAACVCPEDNNGPWGCKEYYPAPCASVCKTPYPDNCHKREDVALPQNSYCSEQYDDCASKCRSWVCKSGYTNISDCAWMKCWIKL
mgnify:FL=1